MKPPVELRRLLSQRILRLALGSLLLALPMLWFQARSDIRSESRGAEETAAIVADLLELQHLRGAALDARLADLARPDALSRLRHLRLRLEDGQGRLLTPPTPRDNSFAEAFFLTPEAPQENRYSGWISSGDGRRFHLTLMSSPASEAAEALENLLDLLLWCVVYTVLLVTGIALVMHRAFAPLRSIVEKIAACMSQNYTTRLPAMPMQELDLIGQSLNHLADALDKAETSRRSLSLKMVSLQEEERSRLVQELHDEFGQNLTAMRAGAAYLIRACEGQPAQQAVARELAEQCRSLHGGIRHLLHQLRPLGADEGTGPVPLAELLEKLLAGWRNLPEQEAAYRLHYELDETALPRSTALALYRMTQEALTNAARHAAARHIDIQLQQEGEQLRWSVSDDGIGIAQPEAALQRGNGLAGLRERVWALGGNFNLSPGRNQRGLALAATIRLTPAVP